MSSSPKYTEEFKIEAVRQVVDKGHPVAEVAARLGVSQHSLYKWIKLQQMPRIHSTVKVQLVESIMGIP